MSLRRRLSLETALLACFSALYAVILKLLPGIPAYGFPGAKIQIAVALSPVYGYVLGGALGSASTLLGTLLAVFLIPSKYSVFSLATIPCAALGALTSALTLDRGKILGISKWLYSILIYLILLSAWVATDVGRATLPYVIPHIGAVVLILLKGAFLDKIKFRRRILAVTPKLFIAALAGILADHLLGSLEGIIVFRYVLAAASPESLTAIYLAAIPIALVERGIMIAASFVILINLYLAVGRSGYVRIKLE